MKHSNPLIIVIFGRPGCGKGTQAKLLIKKFGLEYFGMGDALRRRRKIKDFTGRKISKVMEKGKLVPNFIVAKFWIDAMEKLKQKQEFKGCVFDGSPRRVTEANLFDDALGWYEWTKRKKIILIDISEKEALKRLAKRRICRDCKIIIPYIGEFKKLKKCPQCGAPLITRTDDKPKAIKKRLAEFKKEVVPVLNYYKKQGRLTRINGDQSIEKVFKDILKVI